MILGLHGKMGSGKNEAARRLRKIASLPVVEVSFAAKLKESAAALLGIHVDDLELYKNDAQKQVALGSVHDGLGFVAWKPKTQTVREFLQRYGTEAHRDVFGLDFWLDSALPLDRDYSDALYVATDVRFENEAQRVRQLGGLVVRIIGPNEETGDHPSEQVVSCDHVIANLIRDDGFHALDARLRDLFRFELLSNDKRTAA